jgi:hypothetical protein
MPGFILLILLLLGVPVTSSAQQVLQHRYSFVGLDGQLTTLYQSRDTLYEQFCYLDKPCWPKPTHHYRILAAQQQDEFYVLKLEALDSVQLSSTPYPATRFAALILQNLSSQQCGYFLSSRASTQEQIEQLSVSSAELRKKFYFTFFSESYLATQCRRKQLSTKAEADLLGAELKKPEYTALAAAWQANPSGDLYASSLTAELLNRACIRQGFSLCGAAQKLQALLK